jgi:uncharacterized phage protein gp47/JayE
MAGITSTGFVKKTLAEIKTELEDAYRNAFGASLNVAPPSVASILIGIAAEREAKLWDLSEETWNSRSPSTATGVSLDNAGELTANRRLDAKKSQVDDQVFSGTIGTRIDTTAVFSVVGNPEAKFRLDSPVILEDATPQATGKLVAIEDGPTVAQAGTLSVIETPVTGLSSTTNLSDATVGRYVETDVAYRVRRADELAIAGATTVEAIRTRVKQVEGVEEALVFANKTMSVDAGGRPPKSVQVFVDGGTDEDVAGEIWLSVGGGIETFGDIENEVVDSQGLTQLVYFSRPIVKRTYVILDVMIDPATFPADGADQIRAAIMTFGQSLKIGEKVLTYPKLLPAIVESVDGILDISIRLGFTSPPTVDDNLTAAPNERISFDSSDVTVNLTS